MKTRYVAREICSDCKKSAMRCHMMRNTAGQYFCQTCRKNQPKQVIETYNLNGRDVTREEWENRNK